MADDPKPEAPLDEKYEKRSEPAEPLEQTEGFSEAQQDSLPEDQVDHNEENIILIGKETSKAKLPSSGEEGMPALGTCMSWLHRSCSSVFSPFSHWLFFPLICPHG